MTCQLVEKLIQAAHIFGQKCWGGSFEWLNKPEDFGENFSVCDERKTVSCTLNYLI